MVIHGEHSLHDLELLSQLKNISRTAVIAELLCGLTVTDQTSLALSTLFVTGRIKSKFGEENVFLLKRSRVRRGSRVLLMSSIIFR